MSAHEEGTPQQSRLPRWAPRVRRGLLGAIAVLYLISIPWYRSAGEPDRWFGLPDWVAVALLCYGGIALLNAAAWLLTDIRDGDDP